MKHFSDALFEELLIREGAWCYQTWTRSGSRGKPVHILAYGESTLAKYDKNTFDLTLGADWKRHIIKLVEWLNDYYPGFFLKKETPDSASYTRFYPTKEEAIAYIEKKNILTI